MEVMMSPDASDTTLPEPGLDTRLAQIEASLKAAKLWLEANGAEVMGEKMMTRDLWDIAYNQLQDQCMEETRKTVARLEAERKVILSEQSAFKAWCEERYGSGGDE